MKITIALRPITGNDADFMMGLVSDPEVTRFIPGLIGNRDLMKEWIAALPEEDREFMVLLDGTAIGECNLTVNGDSAEIGFLLLPEYWRKGYGTEVVRQLLEMAEKSGIREVTAMTDQRNAAAIGLLEKTGFAKQSVGWFLQMPEDTEDTGFTQTVETYRKTL